MDSMNTREYRSKIAKKIIKLRKELENLQAVDNLKTHSSQDQQYIIKLKQDKERLQAELVFMCRKVATLSDEIIEALRTD
ncbi:CiV19.5g2-like-3 protein [Chelonus insularis]|nr:CiV19.5g2-like-3 protein [Chelonus insularis]